MGRPRFKVYINVYIKRISGLDEKFNGHHVYIEWTRGGKIGQSSKQTGLTRKALVRDGAAIFDEHIEFCGTLIQSSKGDGFNQKFFTLLIHEFVSAESKKKPFTLKYKMNITEFIKKINEKLTATIPISGGISLDVVVSSRLISSKSNDDSDSENDDDDGNDDEVEEEGGKEGEADDEEGKKKKKKKSGHDKRKSKLITDKEGNDGGNESDGDTEDKKKGKSEKSDDSSSLTSSKKSKDKDKKKKKKKKKKEKKGSDDDDDDNDESDGVGTDILGFSGIYPGLGDFSSPFNEKDNQALIESLKREVDVLKEENKEQEQRIEELRSKMAELKLLQQGKTTDMDENILQFKRKEEEAAAAEATENAKKGKHLKRQAGTLNLLTRDSRKSLNIALQPSGSSSPLTSSSSSVNGEEVSQAEETKDLIKFINAEIYSVTPEISEDNLPLSSNIIFDKLMECNALRKDDPQKVLSKVLYSIDCALVSCEGNLEKASYWLSTFCRILVLVRGLLSDESLGKDDRQTRHEIGFECFSLRLKTVYSDIIRTVLLDVKRSFVPAIIKGDSEMLTSGSLQQARGPRPFYAMKSLVLNPLQQSLDTLRANAVPQSVVVQVFTQVSYTMCAVVLNYVMRHKEVNNADMGLKIRMELSKFRDWLHGRGISKAYEALTPLEEATIVMITEKSLFSDPSLISSICPSLSLAQVRIILSGFGGDQVSQSVLLGLRSQSALEDVEEMDETFVNRISYDFLETSQ